MGALKCGSIDFNNVQQVHNLQQRIQKILNDNQNYHQLAHTNRYYFSTSEHQLPASAGWYIILDDKIPIYVGKAKNLNNRLNSENGSRDQYANPQRKADIERNFVKKYSEHRIINRLRVCIVSEAALFPSERLTELDRGNIEKHLNIMRATFTYK